MLTFLNAPTYVRDGRRYVDCDAALALAARIAKEDVALLDLLAERD